jgi:hypothetical protein
VEHQRPPRLPPFDGAFWSLTGCRLAALVESANDALYQFSDGVSEDAREPYNGCITIDGDLLRVRFGRVPRSSPDAGYLAAELEPIPIGDIIIDE